MDDKIWQEFYCGECEGYFRVKLNVSLNRGVEMVCPNCGHKHHRYIKDGVIFEFGRNENSPKEEILPPKSAYSKEPLTARMAKSVRWEDRRNGSVINQEEDLNPRNGIADDMIKDRWFELYGTRGTK